MDEPSTTTDLKSDTGHTLRHHVVFGQSHEVERQVRKTLLSDPGLRFSSLVIRRIPNGVCLEGVLESDSESSEVCDLARQVAGVQKVLNHLVMKRTACPPPKG